MMELPFFLERTIVIGAPNGKIRRVVGFWN